MTVCVPSVNLLVVKQIREGWWKSLDWPGARRAIIGSKVMGLHEWFGDFLRDPAPANEFGCSSRPLGACIPHRW